MRVARKKFCGFLAMVLACGLVTAAGAQGQDIRNAWPRTDFAKRIVELSEIESGGPPKDGIPAIDNPRFVSVAQAQSWLKPREPVIALMIGGEARAYPIQILMFHEIVNDSVGGTSIAVTFCPLCNASVAFDRRVEGRTLDFGTTGRLRHSDLVMYDRQTESWWQQFTGQGIVGHFAGTPLRKIPSSIVAFADFASAHPNGAVLSRETGFVRRYGQNPYVGYDHIDQSPVFRVRRDPRLPPMERVISVNLGGRNRIYPLALLEKHRVANAELAGVPYVVFARPGMASPLDSASINEGRPIAAAAAFSRRLAGRILEFKLAEGRIIDRDTGSAWNILGEATAGPLKGLRLEPLPESGVHFAFAWLAFNPDSEIIRVLP